MACHERQRILVLANSREQAQSNVFSLLRDIFENSPALAGYVSEADVSGAKLRVPGLDNECVCAPCNWRTVQGRPRQDVLALDEAHAAENPKAAEFARGQLEAVDSQCLVSSSAGPPVDSNMVFRLYEARKEPWLFFSYLREHQLPWAVALGVREKATLLPAVWAYMHENAWGASGDTLFSADVIAGAAAPFEEPTTAAEWQALLDSWGLAETRCLVGLGLDRAGVSSSGDRSVLATAVRFWIPGGESLFVLPRVTTLRTGSEAEILAEVDLVNRVFGGYKRAFFEFYGCSDCVQKVRRATLQNPTLANQGEWFSRVFRAMDEGRLVFPAAAGVDHRTRERGLLKAELLRFESEVTTGGTARFGVGGGHDDHCYGTALAVASVAEGIREPARPCLSPFRHNSAKLIDDNARALRALEREAAHYPERLATIRQAMGLPRIVGGDAPEVMEAEPEPTTTVMFTSSGPRPARVGYRTSV